ncbi:MAG: hypothetical protein M9936_12360 [Caldilinea sp.]|nr:hypothetical protein [Caldilinea sp.]HRW47339.1 hypothetical protein [Caldilinea sp.]
MVETNRIGIGNEGSSRRRKSASVAQHVRDTHFIQPAVEAWICRTIVEFFGPQYQVRIIGVARRPAVSIAGVAASSGTRSIGGAIHEDRQRTGQTARDSHVMPLAVGDIPAAARGRAAGANRYAKSNPAIVQRNAEISVVAGIIDVAVDDDISGDPAIPAVTSGAPLVDARLGLDPELDGEIGDAHINRAGRIVNRYLDTVNIAGCMAKETQRIGGTVNDVCACWQRR